MTTIKPAPVPRDRKVHWRCFHCGETFTIHQARWAREHFGRDEMEYPVCLIRSAGEDALLSALRSAQDELAGYRYEDGKILRAMHSMAADHRRAVTAAEEAGYSKGVQDTYRELKADPNGGTAA